MSPGWDKLQIKLNGSSLVSVLPATAIHPETIAYLCLEQVRKDVGLVAAIDLGVQDSTGQDMDMDQGELGAFVVVF